MFWKYNTTSSSQIDTLLAKEDVTLEEIMDSEDIITECRVQNKNLIDFLLKANVIDELVTLTTKEPPLDLDEQTRFKHPNVACELLTCDVPAINERLAGDKDLLDKLYTFLENEPPLNPLLASYFSKIMGGLIAKKTEQNWLSYQLTCLQVFDFLKARESFLPSIKKHLGTSAIMDLTLKFMTQVEGVEMRQRILQWLNELKLIEELVGLLNPKVDRNRHDNVAQLLGDFLKFARETQRNSQERNDPDHLLNTLESPETAKLLLDQIFDGELCESSIVGGISVLMALLDTNVATLPMMMSDEHIDLEHQEKVINQTVEAIIGRLKDFIKLLLDPPKHPIVQTTVGTLDPPLGRTRLQVVRLLSTLVSLKRSEIQDQLIEADTFNILLDLFFKYPWNNFLHTQVENCIVPIVEDTNEEGISPLCKHLLDKCNLIERCTNAWKTNESEEKPIRLGYMGHLISIMDHTAKLKPLAEFLKENKQDTAIILEEFIGTTLADELELQAKLLAGVHPSAIGEVTEDFGDMPFSQNSVMPQQSFSQYQMQNLSSHYLDNYSGFNDDAFNDGDETLQTIQNPSEINFEVSETEQTQRDAIFKQICDQSINTLFEPDDQAFEVRDHSFLTVIEKKDAGDNSSDSDDENRSLGDDNMDVDPWSSPKSADPWTNPPSEETSASWADFSRASFTNFDQAFADMSPTKSKIENADGDGTKGFEAMDTEKEGSIKMEEKEKEAQPSMSVEGDTGKASESEKQCEKV